MKNFFMLIWSSIAVCSVSFAQEVKDIFTYKVGEYEVTLLSEGQQKGNGQVLIGATPEMLEKYMIDGTYSSAVNAFLVKTPVQSFLIDTGFGRKLEPNMQAAGVNPNEIFTVFITHMHGDHTGGLVKDGVARFPESMLVIAEAEYDYWTSKEEMNKQPENRRGGFQSAQKILTAYKDSVHKIQPIKLGEQNGDGIFAIEAYGHTPGHVSYLVSSNGDQLLIWGDLTHAMAIQMPYPQVAVTYDTNPEQAVVSRKKVLEYVSKHKIPVAGMHVAYPGMGMVEVDDSVGGYKFIPISSVE